MVDINLIPWREVDHHKKIQRMLLWVMLIMMVIVAVGWGYYKKNLKQLQLQMHRSDDLAQEMQKLRLIKTPSTQMVQDNKRIREHRSIPKEKKLTQEPLQVRIVTIHYAKAIDLAAIIRDKSTALLSRRGTIAVDARTNVVWLEDTETQIKKMVTLIKCLDIPAQQIIIEARLVTMNQDSAQDLGIRLGLIRPNLTPVEGGSGFQQSSDAGHFGVNMAATPINATAATIGFAEALFTSQRLLDIELSALESEGRAKVIASPRLVTSNQVAALIESGEDIPYQEFSLNGTTSVAFKKAVLRLKVVPRITVKHELMMSLMINQDSDSGKRVQGVPIISTKFIETNILVHHGQTIVLGGIYQEDHNHQTDQVPLLGHLPIVGELFQKNQMRTRHEALLIFITPKIVT